MKQIELHWIEKQRFLGIDSNSRSIVLSAPGDVGVSPAETLLMALASCSAYDIVAIIAKQRAILKQLRVKVDGIQSATLPHQFTAIHLRYDVEAEQLSEQQLQRAVDLALNHYCTVRASLSEAIMISFEVVLNN